MLVFIDDKIQLKKLGVTTTVISVANQKSTKDVVDKLVQKISPDYILIFGSIDIVAQIDLLNPVYDPDDDSDKHVKSDLPYACDAAYSNNINNFLTPTRVP